jgi:hypothetical protein
MDKQFFIIGVYDFELYRAASGDYCVTVSKYAEPAESYNLGTLENAYKFILSFAGEAER